MNFSKFDSSHYKTTSLRSVGKIGLVNHPLPKRIRAHASICFMALIQHRVMHMHLAVNTAYARAGAEIFKTRQVLGLRKYRVNATIGAPESFD